jgi:hypothetical protein
MIQIVYFLVMLVVLVFSFVTNWYAILGISLLVLLMVMILYKIGNGIVLLEVTAILYVFTCIIMPMIGYEYYSYNNRLSRVWVRYMPIKPELYFAYALPAITCFCMAITWPGFKKNSPDSGVLLKDKIIRIRKLLQQQENKGLQIMLVGVVVSLVAKFLPVSVNYFATLFFFGSFAGLLYIHLSPDFRRKKVIMLLFLVFIIWNALQSGMFTIVAYMGITIFSFFQLGKSSSMLKKITLMLATIVFFIVLQNVKSIYRKQTWNKPFEGNKVELFSNLFIENAQKGVALLSEEALFPIYSRTNQGFNVALVMKRIPAIQPYDNGNRLVTVFASAFVPRFLWTDKPEAGGKFNMKYYAGYNLKGWSTNVGPLGEAYGSFGVAGGIMYMLFLGFFLRWVYLRVFALSNNMPLLICWLPVLFYLITSSAETDTLQVLNSIIKSAFFIWLLTKVLPGWFGVVKEKLVKRTRIKNSLA